MKKSLLVGLITIMLALLSTIWSGVSAQTRQIRQTDSAHAANAAYRDGLFLGKLDARSGNKHRVCSGRWSAQSDRVAFVSGYEDGYAQAAAPNVNQTED